MYIYSYMSDSRDGFKLYLELFYFSFDFENSVFASSKLVQVLGSMNEVESYSLVIKSNFEFVVFGLNLSYLSVVGYWFSGILFHIFWSGNYLVWLLNLLNCMFILHSMYDIYLGSYFLGVFLFVQNNYSVAMLYSSVYNLLYTVGVSSNLSLFNIICSLQIISLLFLVVLIWYLYSSILYTLFCNKFNFNLIFGYYSNLNFILFGFIKFSLSYYFLFVLGLTLCIRLISSASISHSCTIKQLFLS